MNPWTHFFPGIIAVFFSTPAELPQKVEPSSAPTPLSPHIEKIKTDETPSEKNCSAAAAAWIKYCSRIGPFPDFLPSINCIQPECKALEALLKDKCSQQRDDASYAFFDEHYKEPTPPKEMIKQIAGPTPEQCGEFFRSFGRGCHHRMLPDENGKLVPTERSAKGITIYGEWKGYDDDNGKIVVDTRYCNHLKAILKLKCPRPVCYYCPHEGCREKFDE